MKIVLTSTGAYQMYTGASRSTFTLAQWLREADIGYDVQLWTDLTSLTSREIENRFKRFQPDVYVTYGKHPNVKESLRIARALGVTTVFALRSIGFERDDFEYVDHFLTISSFLQRHYGVPATIIPPPINWADVQAPTTGQYVTFINGIPEKGLNLFINIVAQLGAERPDIPVLVVESVKPLEHFSTFFPNVTTMPKTLVPSEIYARTRILLVPSAMPEGFGRVAVEAMINGIPPIVSDQGALPETVGSGGTVVPLETRFWVNTICKLYDWEEYYSDCSDDARVACERYKDTRVCGSYLDYFEGLRKSA